MTSLCLPRSAGKLWELQHEIEVRSEPRGAGGGGCNCPGHLPASFPGSSSHWGPGVTCHSFLSRDCGWGPSVMFICPAPVLEAGSALGCCPETLFVPLGLFLLVSGSILAENILSVVEANTIKRQPFWSHGASARAQV